MISLPFYNRRLSNMVIQRSYQRWHLQWVNLSFFFPPWKCTPSISNKDGTDKTRWLQRYGSNVVVATIAVSVEQHRSSSSGIVKCAKILLVVGKKSDAFTANAPSGAYTIASDRRFHGTLGVNVACAQTICSWSSVYTKLHERWLRDVARELTVASERIQYRRGNLRSLPFLHIVIYPRFAKVTQSRFASHARK